MKLHNIVNVPVLLPEVVTEVMDKYGRPKELSITSLPTLDNKLWGLRKGKLVIVAGRPSQGKSAIVLQMGTDFALQGHPGILFSIEMTNQICGERIISNRCEIDNRLLITGELSQEYEKHAHKINALHENAKDMKFTLIESGGKTFQEMFALIEKYGDKIDFVIIDYIQMIKQAEKKTKKETIDDYIKNLREYAIEKDFCAIITSQINRGTHEGHKIRKPEVWELKGSGELEEHADTIILVHWDYFYTSEEEDKEKYWIKIAKNRDGRTGAYECRFEPQYYRISEGNELSRLLYGRTAPEPDSTPDGTGDGAKKVVCNDKQDSPFS